MNSRDMDGLRAGQRGHAIEHARADGNLGGLGANRARCQVPVREYLQAVHQCLGQRAPVITTALLPVPPAALADDIDRAVAPSRAGRSLRPRRRTIAWRDQWCVSVTPAPLLT